MWEANSVTSLEIIITIEMESDEMFGLRVAMPHDACMKNNNGLGHSNKGGPQRCWSTTQPYRSRPATAIGREDW